MMKKLLTSGWGKPHPAMSNWPADKPKPSPAMPPMARWECHLNDDERRARAAASLKAQTDDNLPFDAAIGFRLGSEMKSWLECNTQQPDQKANRIGAWESMCNAVCDEVALGDRPGQPADAVEDYEDRAAICRTFGKAYSLVTGVVHKSGQPLSEFSSNHKRMEAMRNFPHPDILADAKLYHAKGVSKLQQAMDGEADRFVAASDAYVRGATEKSPLSELKVKRKSREAVR